MKGLVAKNKVLVLRDDLEIPKPKADEVLIKIACASVNPTDLDFLKGKYDLWLKLLGGEHAVKTGLEFSGTVIEGPDTFKTGERVFGYVDLLRGQKTHQEYICISADYIARMPENLNFEQAAALPLGALTSLVALSEVGKVKTGTRLLVNGASGGLGVYSLQLARILGAHTTAFAGPGQEEFLVQLGADETYNYRETRIDQLDERYDVFLDLSAKRRFHEVKPILADNGMFIPLEPDKHISSFVMNLFSPKKIKYLLVDKGNKEKLTQISDWVEKNMLHVFVDSVYRLDDYQNAFERLSAGGKQGRVVMKIGDDQ